MGLLTSIDANLLRDAAMTYAMNPGVVQGLIKVTEEHRWRG